MLRFRVAASALPGSSPGGSPRGVAFPTFYGFARWRTAAPVASPPVRPDAALPADPEPEKDLLQRLREAGL